MKTSVIIPSYNHAAFVAEAIRSVLTQESADLELIVVDDGSTDESIEVIEKTFSEFPAAQTQLHPQSNQGAHKAINTGISLARGTASHCSTQTIHMRPTESSIFSM